MMRRLRDPDPAEVPLLEEWVTIHRVLANINIDDVKKAVHDVITIDDDDVLASVIAS
jgi:hypothetical protein